MAINQIQRFSGHFTKTPKSRMLLWDWPTERLTYSHAARVTTKRSLALNSCNDTMIILYISISICLLLLASRWQDTKLPRCRVPRDSLLKWLCLHGLDHLIMICRAKLHSKHPFCVLQITCDLSILAAGTPFDRLSGDSLLLLCAVLNVLILQAQVCTVLVAWPSNSLNVLSNLQAVLLIFF